MNSIRDMYEGGIELDCVIGSFFLRAEPNDLYQGQTYNFEFINPMLQQNEFQWKAETGSFLGFGKIIEGYTSRRCRLYL